MIKTESKITLTIGLDENRVPEKIGWCAEDGGVKGKAVKAVFLSVWDPDQREALRVDLWTKDMPLDDMKNFFHQVFIAMSSTYSRATSEEKLATEIEAFGNRFAKQAGLSHKGAKDF